MKLLGSGGAGYSDSSLLGRLLKLDRRTIGLNNFTTDHRHNLEQMRQLVTPEQRARFDFIEGELSIARLTINGM